MARINNHHIRYRGQKKEEQKDWELDLAATEHKAISHVQRSKANEELYARMINNLHSL
ncbi:MAG: hypothetical protein ACXADW_14140 [Candidatus Hodarchaeales archaeon]|jgi:hypothetical protein